MFRCTSKERKVLKGIGESRFPHTKIMWVYFVYENGGLIYIGASRNPKKRFSNHKCNTIRNWQKTKTCFTFIGPYPTKKALEIERQEIEKNAGSCSLKNIHGNKKAA